MRGTIRYRLVDATPYACVWFGHRAPIRAAAPPSERGRAPGGSIGIHPGPRGGLMFGRNDWLMIAGALLAVLSLLHSAMGERAILGPLFRERGWSLPFAERPAVQSLLRFAWHLTTFAWLGMSA